MHVTFKLALFPVKLLVGLVFAIIGFLYYPILTVVILAPFILLLIMWGVCKTVGIV